MSQGVTNTVQEKKLYIQILIVVQQETENSLQFSDTLTRFCNSIFKKPGYKGDLPPGIKHMTTASDGRQTATIEYYIEQ